MRFLAPILGIAIMLVVLLDAFEAMVLPRRATRKYRPARFYYRFFWYLWVHVADRFKRRGLRQHFLSTFGPLSLLGLFSLWVVSLIVSFALFHWSLGSPMGSENRGPQFRHVRVPERGDFLYARLWRFFAHWGGRPRVECFGSRHGLWFYGRYHWIFAGVVSGVFTARADDRLARCTSRFAADSWRVVKSPGENRFAFADRTIYFGSGRVGRPTC